MDWYLTVLKKYAVFEGRARRKEYWMFFLFNIIISIILGAIAGALKVPFLAIIYTLAVLIPGLSVSVRRLHDISKSGLWILIVFIPIIGPLVFLVFMVLDSHPGDNQFGPNPKVAAE